MPSRGSPSASNSNALPLADEALWLPVPSSGDANDAVAFNGAPVRWVGRSPQSPTDPNAPRTLAWSGSGLRARFTQSTTLTVRQSFDGTSRAILAVSIDGGPPTLLAAAQTTATLRGLDPAVIHTVTITKRTEPAFGASVIEGLSLDAPGAWLAPPPAAVRRLEVIGDGTSIGFGVAGAPGCAGAASDEDATAAFASLAAAAVGAEVRLSAWTGSGVLDDSTGNHAHAPAPTAQALWQRADALDASSVWDFAAWVPQVVVIYVGADDFAGGDPGAMAFVPAYTDLVNAVRLQYGQETVILCGVGPTLTGTALTQARSYLDAVVQSFNQHGDEQVYLLDYTPVTVSATGCLGYPDLAGAAAMADALVRVMHVAVGW